MVALKGMTLPAAMRSEKGCGTIGGMDDAVPFGQKASRSADASWREECRRIEQLTVWERMLLALRLGRRAPLRIREDDGGEGR